MTDQLTWLEDFFLSLCDGDWEHDLGFRIETLDNPGWKIELSLKYSRYEGVQFDPVRIARSEHDWIICRLENGVFLGQGGPKNLKEILHIAEDWVLSIDKQNSEQSDT